MGVVAIPTMKSLDSDKKAAKTSNNNGAQAASTASAEAEKPVEKIDFSKVKVEPLFEEFVDFDTFSKSDFRAVKVKECVAVPKSKKLLQFTLDDGTGTERTILSGIHSFYEPEELVGKTLIAITNLPPRAMMGIDSCGMLLSAIHEEEGEEKLHLLMVDDHIPAGAKNSVYLPTKKIGKNNPKAEEIAADNATRQEWNRTADMALVSGIEEAKILEIKQTEIHDKVSQSIKSEGWLPNLFRRIVNKAKDILQNLIREYGIPPKPSLDIDMTEFCTMRNLMIRVQDEARGIRNLQDNILPKLKTQLAETTGIFKGKERKALTEQIQQTEQEIDRRLDKLPDILREDGYPDVQAFMATYREAEAVVEQYNRDLAEWERQVKQKSRPPRPPEKESVRNRLRQLQEQGRQQKPRKKSFDRGSR